MTKEDRELFHIRRKQITSAPQSHSTYHNYLHSGIDHPPAEEAWWNIPTKRLQTPRKDCLDLQSYYQSHEISPQRK